MKRFLAMMSLVGLTSGCGAVEPVPPEALETGVWLDVRTPAEFAQGHVEGALNLSHDQIREDHPLLVSGDLPKDKPILAYCRSGRRSGIAKSLLEPMGYTVIDVGSFGNAQATARKAAEPAQP